MNQLTARRTTPLLISCLIMTGLALFGCTPEDGAEAPPPETGRIEAPAIYGSDDRLDVYAHPDARMRALAKNSIVALLYPHRLDERDPAAVVPIAQTLGDKRNFCEGVAYREQLAVANCSGTLIDDDLVLTAGHCVDDLDDCRSQRLLFGFYMESADQLAPLTSEDVFRCKRVAVRIYEGDLDYAIIQLDRPATPRFSVAPMHTGAGAAPVGSALGIIGFGSGLPAKIDTGGVVTESGAPLLESLRGTTDSFGGNSGSGVFNSNSELMGILVAGADDYDSTAAGCQVLSTFPAHGEGEGENIVYAHNAIQALCAIGWESQRLCPNNDPSAFPWCQSCQDDPDCPSDWDCRSWPSNPDDRWCSRRCTDDTLCPADHFCGTSGYCVPDRSNVCIENTIWEVDACSTNIEQVQSCSSNQRCEDDTCIPLCDNACDNPGERACADPEGHQECTVDPDGCMILRGTKILCTNDEVCQDGACITTNDAFCGGCSVDADCPPTWDCRHWSVAPSASWCGAPCSEDTDCSGEQYCSRTSGYCAPVWSLDCNEGAIWSVDSCGRPLQEEEKCSLAEVCNDAICSPRCLSGHACESGALRCANNEQIERCETSETGCRAWEAPADCPDAGLCIDGEGCALPADAWCAECASKVDCPAGWSCAQHPDAEDVSWCARPCNDPGDCRDDHGCQNGLCAPKEDPQECVDGLLQTQNTCGATLRSEESCATTPSCDVEQCTPNASRCSETGVEACELNPRGCWDWTLRETCPNTHRCAFGEGCVELPPTEAEDTHPTPTTDVTPQPKDNNASEDDCSCQVRVDHKEKPPSAWNWGGALLLFGLLWRRRSPVALPESKT